MDITVGLQIIFFITCVSFIFYFKQNRLSTLFFVQSSFSRSDLFFFISFFGFVYLSNKFVTELIIKNENLYKKI